MKPPSNPNQPTLEEVLAAARLYRHEYRATPLAQERIRLLLALIRMRQAGQFRAIQCENCENSRGLYLDLDTNRHPAERLQWQFVSWERAAAIVGVFETKKPPAREVLALKARRA